MSAAPLRTALADTYPSPSNSTFKTGIGAFWDFVTGLLGTTGNKEDALDALRVLDSSGIYNLSLVPSVGASLLTMTAKTRAGATPSSSDPVMIGQRNATAGSGDFNLRKIDAACSLAISSGSTLGHASATPGTIYWYVIDNAGTEELAASSTFFGQSGIVTTVAEGGAGTADSATVMYSTVQRTAVPFRCVGRTVDTQVTAGAWAALPTTMELGPFVARQALGQCRLTKSSTNLLLSPFGGNVLSFPDGDAVIPSAGITLAGSGSSGTTYFIYATKLGGLVNALENSATGHSTDALTGIEIKTGDPTRVLVGMARPIAGPAWVDTAAQRFVISYFNRRAIAGRNNFTTNRSTASGGMTEINSEIRTEFLTWADEAVMANITGADNQSGANPVLTALDYDSSVNDDGFNYSSAGTTTVPVSVTNTKTHTEGYHYYTVVGRVITAGTGTWLGGAAASTEVTTIQTLTRG